MSEFEGLSQYPIKIGELPESWELSSLFKAGCEVESGFASGKHNSTGDGVVHLRPMNVDRCGRIDLSIVKSVAADKSHKRIHRGDVLFNNTNSPALVGKTAHVGLEGDWAFSNHMTRIEPSVVLDAQFVAHHLHYLWSTGYFAHICTNHVNQASISSKRLGATVPLVVPPLAEQRRIVAAIEEHCARLDAADAAVESAETQARFMESAALHAWTKDERTRPMVELMHDARYGTSVKCSYEADGPAVLRIPNVVGGRLAHEDLKYATADVSDGAFASAGEILFVRTNGSRDLIGRCAVVPDGHPQVFASYLIGASIDSSLARSSFVNAVMRSPRVRHQIVASASTSAGQYNLSISKIGAIEVPVPTLARQDEVLDQLASLEPTASRVRADLSSARARSASVRRSILAAAFAGQLVPQVPTDEPASMLLERITSERSVTRPSRLGRKS